MKSSTLTNRKATTTSIPTAGPLSRTHSSQRIQTVHRMHEKLQTVREDEHEKQHFGVIETRRYNLSLSLFQHTVYY